MRHSAYCVPALFLLALSAGCDAGNSSTNGSCGTDCGFTPNHTTPSGSPVEYFGQLGVVDTKLVDQAGMPVQLRGVSSMWLNWETDGYAESGPGIEWMRDTWGLSLVRASMGVEPAGAYLSNPGASLARVHSVIQNAIELGVYVLVDWHDHNAQDHQAEAQKFFTEIATTYGKYPNIIYEPFNEPLELDWSKQLKPYHEALVATIRAIDPDNVIVLGTPQWSQRVKDAAASPVAGEHLMYTLHFYACTHKQSLRDDAAAAIGMGLPLFVTEWGATGADGGVANPEVCTQEGQAWHSLMNKHSISWAAWKLDGCTDASCIFKMGAPKDGPFTDEWLNGHGSFVRDRMIE